MLIDFILSIKLPVSSGYIKFWGSQKLHVYFQLCGKVEGPSMSLSPALFKGNCT